MDQKENEEKKSDSERQVNGTNKQVFIYTATRSPRQLSSPYSYRGVRTQACLDHIISNLIRHRPRGRVSVPPYSQILGDDNALLDGSRIYQNLNSWEATIDVYRSAAESGNLRLTPRFDSWGLRHSEYERHMSHATLGA